MTRRSAATTPDGGWGQCGGRSGGARVVLTLPATVPSQDPVSGAATTGDLATVTVRDRP